MDRIRVLNMTSLFKKEMLIYSFFDIKLNKPLRLVWFGYFFMLVAIWSVPIVLLTGIPGPYMLALILAVPFGGATVMSKPIWGGKSFFDYAKTQIKYLSSPKYYYDGTPGKKMKVYNVDSAITVSRHRDFAKLYKLEKEHREKGAY